MRLGLVIVVFDHIIHGIGKELVGASLLPQNLVEHAAVLQQLALPSAAGVEFVVKVLQRACRKAHVLHVEIRIALPAGLHARQLVVEPLYLPGQRPRRHVDDHLLEGLVIVKRKHRNFLQGDGIVLQHDEHGVGRQRGIHGNQLPPITQTTYPERIHRLGGDQKQSFEVRNGAAMRHLADHMSVAHRNQAVGSNNPTQYRNLVLEHLIVALGLKLGDNSQKKQ